MKKSIFPWVISQLLVICSPSSPAFADASACKPKGMTMADVFPYLSVGVRYQSDLQSLKWDDPQPPPDIAAKTLIAMQTTHSRSATKTLKEQVEFATAVQLATRFTKIKGWPKNEPPPIAPCSYPIEIPAFLVKPGSTGTVRANVVLSDKNKMILAPFTATDKEPENWHSIEINKDADGAITVKATRAARFFLACEESKKVGQDKGVFISYQLAPNLVSEYRIVPVFESPAKAPKKPKVPVAREFDPVVLSKFKATNDMMRALGPARPNQYCGWLHENISKPLDSADDAKSETKSGSDANKANPH